MIGFEVLLVAIIVLARGGHCRHMACNLPAKDPGVFDIHEMLIKHVGIEARAGALVTARHARRSDRKKHFVPCPDQFPFNVRH